MTTLLGAADLTWMRSVQEQAMPGTAIIQRGTVTNDGMGGGSVAWNAVGTAIARLYSQNSRAIAEAVSGAELISETRWYVTMPYGTQVRADDRLSIGGRRWHITEVNNSQDWKTAVRCSVYALNEESA